MINVVTSTYESGGITEKCITRSFEADRDGVEKNVINLYPGMHFQTFKGFGGALTESSGFVYSQMPAKAQDEMLNAYYGAGGLGYRFARTHIDSCDFSLNNYSAVTDPADRELATFSLERAHKYVLPLIKAANGKAIRPLDFMLTPWSPPAFMKTNGDRNHGGILKDEYYGLWARYICRYISEYKALGINVTMLSPQNEPKAAQTWDSCIFTAEQEGRFIREYLAPELKKSGLGDIEIIIWDHNKERAFDRACEVMADKKTEELVSGVGVHWYSGDHFEALDLIGRRFPGKRLVFTEACVEYSHYKDAPALKNAQMYAHDIIGDLNAGMDTFIDWNIILDDNGGPNHVGNYCEAPVMCDIKSGMWHKQPSYDYIGHFSRYIEPGAVRIGYSRYTDLLEVTAFKNPGGGIAAVVLNRTGNDMPYWLRMNNLICPLEAEAESITTLQID